MKKSIKYTALLALIAVMVLMICACGAKSVTKPAATQGAKTYEITGSATLEKLNDTTLRLHCTTNIAKDAVIAFSIDAYDGEQLAKQVVTMIDGETIYADFEIDKSWKEPIYGTVSITPSEDGKQPSEIQDMYGSKLENVTGDLVLYNANGNFICIKSEQLKEY